MLSCRDVTQRISGDDGASDGLWTRIQLRMHLLVCRHCRRYERQMRAITRAAHELSRQTAPASESIARLRNRILEGVSREKGDSGHEGDPR
jgi:hypothetical protein